MNILLLFPMAVCLMVGFFTAGIVINRIWVEPRVFYPRTVLSIRSKLLQDAHTKYWYHRYSIWCEVVGTRNSADGYLLFSFFGAVIGFLLALLSGNVIVAFSTFMFLLISPTLILYARYTVKINKMIDSFSQFVDLFSRYYSSRKNIVLTFRDMVDECPKELQAELILLNSTLADGGEQSKAVEAFSERLNHEWAHDFATYIISGLEGETADIQASLNRLTGEMFVQQDEKEERRSEIHSIWISLIIVIIICLLFIPYNQSLLKESYRLYFLTADGQALLLMAVMVWVLSILLAFIWGRRHG